MSTPSPQERELLRELLSRLAELEPLIVRYVRMSTRSLRDIRALRLYAKDGLEAIPRRLMKPTTLRRVLLLLVQQAIDEITAITEQERRKP